MRPTFHVAMAPVVALPVYAASSSVALAAAAAVVEVALDIDHVAEYVVMTRQRVSIKRFIRDYSSLDLPRLVYVFHSYEFNLVLAGAAWAFHSPLLTAVFAGSFLHLVIDELGNRLPAKPKIVPLFYFFTYRLAKKFATPRLIQRRKPL